MNVNFAIIPECNADTNLVETITNSFNSFNHKKGCSQLRMQCKVHDYSILLPLVLSTKTKGRSDTSILLKKSYRQVICTFINIMKNIIILSKFRLQLKNLF